ncbi:MAG: RND family transporter [Candidatus Omnitrophica bacterium]|nr:RND family transporter [Candidatus Omnitrophota bacterium]
MLLFRKIAEFILLLKWPILLCFVLISLLMMNAAFKLQIDPSMEPLFIKGSEEYRYYQEYNLRYGSDEMIAVAMATPDLFTVRHLAKLEELTSSLKKFPQVEKVMSLASVMDIKHKFMGVKIVPALEAFFEGEESLTELRKNILSNPLFVHNLVSADGKIANLVVYLKTTGPDKAKGAGLFIKELQQLLKKEAREGVEFYMAGSPVEQYEFISLIRRDQFLFVPLIALLLIVTTLIIYRSFACMILSMTIVFMTLTWTLGTISLLGKELNLMTSLLAPVIMIIAVVNTVYLMNLFFEIRPHHPSMRYSVILTIEQLGVPSFLTHMTTFLGFFSLALNSIPAIRSFGIFAAVGTFYSYVIELVMTTILLPILPYRRLREFFDERKFFNRIVINFLENLEAHWKWVILAGAALTFIFSVIGISKIRVDTNIVKQMKPDVPLAVATRFIDENLTGVYSLGFVMRRKNGGTFVDYETLEKVDRFVQYLESKPEIPKANSLTTLLKKINAAKEGEMTEMKITSDPEMLERYFKGISESEDPEVWKYISTDLREMRIEARMKAVGTTEGAAVERDILQYLDQQLGHDFDYHVTGNVVLLGKIAEELVQEQAKSFGFAFAAILILITLIFRSLLMGLLAAVPNLIPILAVYAVTGFMGIELSSATAMIASIVLGLVVDASIQFLYRFRHEFKRRFHYLQSLHHTYRNMGQSMIISTIILCAGFGSSVFSSFHPTVHFGLMTSLAIFFALICTLIVLPVCLMMLRPFGKEKLFKKEPRTDEFKVIVTSD